ncbi:MAG: methylenetetrahydrofolate reductase C-terminal domain-containing protein [Candidatus Electrothrix aestuarii]|uniref:Methylenetetrahydrofolate reductase n=1 Tax=Candidatus Electrothrix aestuarii TaxID=3062594 RepID=A0AAU8LT55_9BACT|nr:methylenetetrahydrofolate reductase C-terminal domain-containing protein [Candidatus Electrothrix aestuarii]
MLQTALSTPGEFTLTFELVPRQGFDREHVDPLLDFARQAKADGRIKALSLTDNPGGNPALAPVAIGAELVNMGIEPLIHFSLKDKNRNQIGSHIYLYQRLRLRSLLVMGGDFPNPGYYGRGRPVYDLDSIQLLQLLRDMENGRYPDRSGKCKKQYPTPSIFKGCVVSPFKSTEAEQVWQYAKLLHKIRAGADFVVTQVGFDIRKFEELQGFLEEQGIKIPLLANVFIPTLPLARALAAGKIPGVLLSEDLVRRMEAEAAAGAKHARLDRAALMVSRLKKCGYNGVHLGGVNLQFQDIAYVLDRVEELDKEGLPDNADCDFPVPGTWYYFQQPAADSGDHPGEKFEKKSAQPLAPGRALGTIWMHKLGHDFFFTEQYFTGRLFARFCLFCAQGRWRSNFLFWLEKSFKYLVYDCQMCGECTLPSSAFLCPQWHCPKRLVNGPCGGSQRGRCEVHPERSCFWVRVYNRLENDTTLADLAAPPHLPPKDWQREKTSSWVNFFSGQENKQE